MSSARHRRGLLPERAGTLRRGAVAATVAAVVTAAVCTPIALRAAENDPTPTPSTAESPTAGSSQDRPPATTTPGAGTAVVLGATEQRSDRRVVSAAAPRAM